LTFFGIAGLAITVPCVALTIVPVMDFLTSTRVEMLLKYWQLPVAVAYPNMSGSEETEPPNLKLLVLSAF